MHKKKTSLNVYLSESSRKIYKKKLCFRGNFPSQLFLQVMDERRIKGLYSQANKDLCAFCPINKILYQTNRFNYFHDNPFPAGDGKKFQLFL